MKKIVEEVSNEGLESLLGESVWIWCFNYIYSGTLSGVNDTDVFLTNAHVVYETGGLCDKIKDAQPLPNDLYIRTSAIESYSKK